MKTICTDIGPVRLARASPIERWVVVIDMVVHYSKEDDEIGDIEENLQCLTVGIPDVSTNDLPRRYQHHTTGVSGRFARLLTRVAQEFMCYHEHHCDY